MRGFVIQFTQWDISVNVSGQTSERARTARKTRCYLLRKFDRMKLKLNSYAESIGTTLEKVADESNELPQFYENMFERGVRVHRKCLQWIVAHKQSRNKWCWKVFTHTGKFSKLLTKRKRNAH